MRIKPASGLKVRDPISRQFLPDDGADIEAIGGMPSLPYWRRLLLDGDVEIVEPPQEAAALPEPEHQNDQADAPAHGS